MATVVNERDVLMRSATSRVVDVSLPSNVTPSQLAGISLTAPSSMFRIATNGDVSPSSIEIVANVRGISGSYTVDWQVTAGTATLTGSGPSRSLSYESMSSDTVTVRGSVTVGALTYESSLTFLKIHDGSVGLPGSRGSLSVARAIAGSTWSDAEALAALVAVGASAPVATDTCTLFNVTANYSEMRRYSGGAWIAVGQSIPGSVLMAGSVTTEKLLVTGLGIALNSDPTTRDISAWTGSGASIAQDSTAPSGASVLKCSGAGLDVRSSLFPIDPTQAYRVRSWIKQVSGTGTAYLYVAFFDADKNLLQGSVYPSYWDHTGVYHYYGLWGQTPSSNWSEFSVSFGTGEVRGIPTSAKFAAIGVMPNFTSTGVTHLAGIICHLKTTGSMVVDGSITAQKLDTRNLTVRDGAGNVAFSADAGLDGAYVHNLNADRITAGLLSVDRIADGSIVNTYFSELFSSSTVLQGTSGTFMETSVVVPPGAAWSGEAHASLIVGRSAVGSQTGMTLILEGYYDFGGEIGPQWQTVRQVTQSFPASSYYYEVAVSLRAPWSPSNPYTKYRVNVQQGTTAGDAYIRGILTCTSYKK